ncbi:hypothetical protein GEU84_014715 [Fertoebacter nigrum]|uniref:Uncharacterized protein n=1 Tax=Fertoeibacter niger TaxID=2656921 RepID=A0A8X8GWK7_9RHOB|nr:hypothetical protein [Fertoeibacter niger]NUB45648.1 hypothetical protein [Fertoeibacter niger]
MPTIEFRTAAPLQAVQRALDELARAGFDLAQLSVLSTQTDAAVRLAFVGAGSVPPRTYALRVMGIPCIHAMSLSEDLHP